MGTLISSLNTVTGLDERVKPHSTEGTGKAGIGGTRGSNLTPWPWDLPDPDVFAGLQADTAGGPAAHWPCFRCGDQKHSSGCLGTDKSRKATFCAIPCLFVSLALMWANGPGSLSCHHFLGEKMQAFPEKWVLSMGGATEVPHVNMPVIKISKIMNVKVLDNKKMILY